MKMRLIDRDRFEIELVAEMANCIRSGDEIHTMAQRVLSVLDKSPTVDAVEVVHGRWVDKTKVIFGQADVCYECSYCETAYYYDAPERYNYCPNCGAKMDLEVIANG